MVRQKNDGGSPAGIPRGPVARGPGQADSTNSKNHPRPESIGHGVTSELDGTGCVQTSSYYPNADNPNRANKGTAASEPNDQTINRGYTDTDMGVPTVSRNTGANRQRFGIDPGPDVLEPPGDTSASPTIPHYGMSSTGGSNNPYE